MIRSPRGLMRVLTPSLPTTVQRFIRGVAASVWIGLPGCAEPVTPPSPAATVVAHTAATTDAPMLPRIVDRRSVEDFNQPLAVMESVFWEPDDTSSLRQLIRETDLARGRTVLEIGTGSGLVALCCLKAGARQVVATDINPAAIACASHNASELHLADRLELRRVQPEAPQAFAVIGAEERFDLIISNPPWEDDVPKSMAEHALYDPNFGLLQSLLAGLRQHLNPEGRALLAYGCREAIERILQLAPQHGFEVRLLDDRDLAQLPEVFLPGLLIELRQVETPAAETAAAETAPRRLYLDEFRPTSELKAPATELHRAKFPCVNVHTHPGKLTDAELDEMVAAMDVGNIAVSVSLDGRTGNRVLEHMHRLNTRHPHRFVVFLRMDYIGEGREESPETWEIHKPGYGEWMADRLTEAVRQGASGLKLLKDLGLGLRDTEGRLIPPDDPRFDPVWERAGELGVPVLWHCADPVAFFRPTDERNERWEELYRRPEWSFYGKDFPAHQELIDARMRVIARHPKTTFICAHMGDIPEDLAQLGRQLDEHPNMHVEIAARVAELGRQPYTARRFFLKYADRILFGTDGVPPVSELDPHWRFLETWDEYFPYEDNPFPPQGFWNIYGLGLPDEVLRKVYHENAVRLIPGVRECIDRAAGAAAPSRQD